MSSELQVISRVPESNLVKNDDVVAIIFLNGKLLTAINTRDNKGIIKAWTPDFQLLYEFVAHEWPINHMTLGEPSHFFTSSSDSTISHWVEKDDPGDGGGNFCERIAILSPMLEPAWRLRYDPSAHRLYSGDSTGEVRMWENDELVGYLGTVEEIWDMLVDSGILYTTRNLDVYLTSLRTKNTHETDPQVNWSIRNIIEGGTGPLYIQNGNLCCMSRRDYKIQIHSLQEVGNPRLAVLEGHEAIVTAITGFLLEGSGGGNVIFSASYDGQVIAWSLATYAKIGGVKLTGYITSLSVDPASGVVFAGGEDRFICALKIVRL